MTTITTRLQLPLLVSSQAQKEITVNEALCRIDAAIAASAIDKDLALAPATPQVGDMYIVATTATGPWQGHDHHLAYFNQIWRFIAPWEGLTLWVNDEDCLYSFNGSHWVKTMETPPPIEEGEPEPPPLPPPQPLPLILPEILCGLIEEPQIIDYPLILSLPYPMQLTSVALLCKQGSTTVTLSVNNNAINAGPFMVNGQLAVTALSQPLVSGDNISIRVLAKADAAGLSFQCHFIREV